MDDIFNKFYAEAKDFPADESALDVIRHKGAIWRERTTGRALVMDTIHHRRIQADTVTDMINQGKIARDECPLSEDVDIYVVPERASGEAERTERV